MVHQTQPQHVVTKAAYILFYRRRTENDNPLGPPYLQQIIKDAYAGIGSSESGEDQRRDDTYSLNGSSGSSLGAAAGASRQLGVEHGPRAGSGGGRRGLEITARSALIGSKGEEGDGLLPEYDEGIGGMEEDGDQPVPSVERHGILAVQDRFEQPSWGFDNLVEDAAAGHGEMDNASDKTFANYDEEEDNDSNAPVFGDSDERSLVESDNEDGGTRYMDAGDEFDQRTAFDHDPVWSEDAGLGEGGVTHVEWRDGEEDEVAEVRIDEEEGV